MRFPAGLMVVSLLAYGTAYATGGDDPKNIIAAQIRDQGYQCNTPQSATQDMQASRPDEAVWTVVCEGASYRVRLDPDMAAKVEKLGQDKKNESGEGSGETGETK
jgi:hypothetical protein